MSKLDACQCTLTLFWAILPWVFFKKIGLFSFICMGFRSQRVWIMGYHRCMGYGLGFSAYQVGNKKYLWGKREYGISELWVKRASTVVTFLKHIGIIVVVPILIAECLHRLVVFHRNRTTDRIDVLFILIAGCLHRLVVFHRRRRTTDRIKDRIVIRVGVQLG